MKVEIVVFPGVEELDFVGFLETLAVANRVTGGHHFEFELVGVQKGPVTCSGGMKVVPDRMLSEVTDFDLLFIPGGGASGGSGIETLLKNNDVLQMVAKSYDEGKRIWSVCTGALVLGKAGLLKGRRATTHHAYVDRIRASGANVSWLRTVTDGRITTGGGISSSIDVGLVLVEDELGVVTRREVESRMEYPPPYENVNNQTPTR